MSTFISCPHPELCGATYHRPGSAAAAACASRGRVGTGGVKLPLPSQAPSATLPTLERRSTDKLKEGDVVVHGGHYLKLTQHREYPHQHGSVATTVHAFRGVPVATTEDPDSWMAAWVKRDGYWTIQGNHLADWQVVDPEFAAALEEQ